MFEASVRFVFALSIVMPRSKRLKNLFFGFSRSDRRLVVSNGRILTIVSFVLLTVLFAPGLSADQFGISRRGRSNPFDTVGSIPSRQPSQSSLSSYPALSDSISQPSGESLPSAMPFREVAASPKTASRVDVSPASARSRYQETIPSAGRSVPLPNVVRLIAFDQGGQSFGSGSYIGNYEEYGLILSNWHVVCETEGLVHVHFSGGFSSFGSVVLSDKKWDLALVAVSAPPKAIPPLPIARTGPKEGDSLWIAGHGSGSYRLAGGNCVRYLAPEIPKNGSPPLYEIIELSVTARQGDSGGPILNRDGELAGVLFGSDMVRNTAGSYCLRVNRFLSQARTELDRLPKRPETFFASIEPNGPRRQLRDTVHIVPAYSEASEIPRRPSGSDGGGSGFGVRSPSRRYVQTPSPALPVFGERSGAPGFPGTNAVSNSTTAPSPSETKDGAPEKTGETTKRIPRTSSSSDGREVRSAVWKEESMTGRPAVETDWSSSGMIDRGRTIVQTRHLDGTARSFDSAGSNRESLLSIPGPFDNNLSALNPRRSSNATDRDLPPPASGTYEIAETSDRYGHSTKAEHSESARQDIRLLEKTPPLTPASQRSFSRRSIMPSLMLTAGTVIALALVVFSFKLLRSDEKIPIVEPEWESRIARVSMSDQTIRSPGRGSEAA